ncbi:amiloride-sensitive amine oxidase [copper-containing]-like [Protopterus annectens]|uniref:amiloride-sensitive amine oxidase [copper-containing]-like n=1 Tax=Protopterus annectens TaxID=7888 RepID=UPI001CFAC27F|nr:amiloride-sensitive amine oxidase [copper-containing]-like [Protopterus annectens]
MLIKPFICFLAFCTFAENSASSIDGNQKASVFSSLSPSEMNTVRDFLMAQKPLQLSPTQSNLLYKNQIFLIDLQLPKKQHVLNYLDKNSIQPRREARVVIFYGDQSKPNVTEYVVGPLPYPYYYRPRYFKGRHPIRYESRPMTYEEIDNIDNFLKNVTEKTYHLMKESYGFWYHNCTDHCLTFSDIAPRGLKSGERRTWLMLQRFVEGYFIHPVGFEILINHQATDPRDWTVEKVWYNGQYFDSIDELVDKYDRNVIHKLKLSVNSEEYIYSTYKPRGQFKTPTNIHGPKLCETQGKRYLLHGNKVEYTGWSFAFRVRTTAGLQLFDICFNGERIAYEVSIQEAIAFYAGHTPAAMQTKYIDAGWMMGAVTYELAKGYDCPETATFLDTYHYFDTDKPIRYKNSLCIFEQSMGMPLRRHFNSNFHGGYNFFGALESHVLIVRTTSTVYNYDYIWDFIFYQNGVMEVKVQATGYIHATFFTPEGLHYGSRVADHVLGNIHTHLVNYKVDLDVAGTENVFKTIDLKQEEIANPWSTDHSIVQSRMYHTVHKTEREAAFQIRKKLPPYLLFYNANKTNKWAHKRGYRIQYNSHARPVMPLNYKEEKGISWARYHLAVTHHYNIEETSSSIYNQNDPWEPPVYFESYIHNNENIVNKDLVAWVTVGFLHIPHSEDIPNTATPANTVGFFLRPFNFFDEDPSVASQSTVIVRPKNDDFSEVEIQRWTPAVVGKCVSDSPFHYNGTYSSD